MKKCRRCRDDKKLSDFHKNVTSKDGYINICKECCKQGKKELYRSRKGSAATRTAPFIKSHTKEQMIKIMSVPVNVMKDAYCAKGLGRLNELVIKYGGTP